MAKKVFIIVGEPSGDLHGANLIRALKKLDPSVEIACWGGMRMEAAGAKILKHIDELAFMGFVEVVLNLPQIISNFKLCRKQIQEFSPDLVVLIDYPGFNLRMTTHIKQLGIPVAYYISPQIWAWKESRVQKIKQFVDHVFVILPFERDFYAKHGVRAEFVGHPLLDELENIKPDVGFIERNGLNNHKKIIALLPGSRVQEIKRMLAVMIDIADQFPEYQIVVSKVSWLPSKLYDECLNHGIKTIEGETYQLLMHSHSAVVASGTATLETAMLKVPEVVVYKADWLSVQIARKLIKIKFISLVNLIMDKEIVKELIQENATSATIVDELKKLNHEGVYRQGIVTAYEDLINKLGGKGASEIVANRLLKIMA